MVPSIRPQKAMVMTMIVSINWPTAVEAIVRIQRCLPPVTSFIFAITKALANSPHQ
jgi:hypothetical protein